jgi:hypothetical protein
MPKRIVDGEAIATSKILRKVESQYRIHYPYLLTLALANGVFECDPETIWATRYALFIPEITTEIISTMLQKFEDAGLLFRYFIDERQYGYWTNIHKAGRLPPSSRLKEKEAHEKLGPYPPSDDLRKFMESHHMQFGCPVDSHRKTTGSTGLGSGLGLGLGFGSGGVQGGKISHSTHSSETGGFKKF